MAAVALFLLFASLSTAQKNDFLWGTATASYQVEGAVDEDGRKDSIWDVFCRQAGKIANGDTGDVADDDYHRFEEDIQLMVDLKLTNYRLSIAWPRILPDGYTVNQAGIQHYAKVIQMLLDHGIEPLVTLYHWDLPQAVYEETNGGWNNVSIVDYFIRYADTVFFHFHDMVRHWLTFNEPWTFCVNGYDEGTHAPGRCSDDTKCAEGDSSTEVYQCTHSVLLSHAAAVKMFRGRGYGENAEIGITLNINWAEPASDSKEDADAAERNLVWQGAWYADPIWKGDYPDIMKEYIGDRLPKFTKAQKEDLKGSWDFFGLNHYTSGWVTPADACSGKECNWATDQRTSVKAKNQHNGTLIGPQADSDWLYVAPYGIRMLMDWIKERYDNPPIYITENGVDVPGENDMTLEDALKDEFRVNYYKQYIGNVTEAKKDGVDIRGYFAWSLMDNFEWADGYSRRFGLHYVDYENNLTRHQKDSAKWFSKYTQSNPTADYDRHLELTR